MTIRTPSEQAYRALHEDYCNDLITRQEYEAGFRRLNALTPPRRRRIWLAIGVVAVVLALMIIYAAQIGAL